MRFVDRFSIEMPEYFSSSLAESARQTIAAFLALPDQERLQRRPETSERVLADSTVLGGLGKLFLGKCAFCEQRSSGPEAYRFRPPINARANRSRSPSFIHYVWLSEDWRNIYPICSDCPRDKDGYFPVEGSIAPIPHAPASNMRGPDSIHPPRERNLLLDPCTDRKIGDHLRFRGSGSCEGLTPRGNETIEFFQLNRFGLIAQRQAVFEQRCDKLAWQLRTRAIEEADPDLFADDALFTGAWTLYLQTLAAGVRRTARPELRAHLRNIPKFFLRLAKRPDAVDLFERAVADELVLSRPAVSKVSAPELAAELSAVPPTTYRPIRSISIRNFKSLEELEVEMPGPTQKPGADNPFITPALLILGENAAGKSTILEALALALASQPDIDALKLDHRRFIIDPQLMGGDNNPANRSASIKVTFGDGDPRNLSIDAMGFHVPDDSGVLVFAYGAFRQYLSRTTRYSKKSGARIATLFWTDRLLSNPEQWLLRLSELDFDMVIRALRPILAIEGDFDVVVRNKQARRCEIVHRIKPDETNSGNAPSPTAAPGEIRTPLREVSSGFRAMLAMACDILRGLMDRTINPSFTSLEDARAIVLVDEVEAHLHPRWKMQIMRGLRVALPRVTFIVTTHDPLCLRGMLDGEVMVLTRTAREELPESATQMPVKVESLIELPDVSKLTIEQLLTSDLFKLFSTDRPETELKLARVADLIAKREKGETLKKDEFETINSFAADIGSALPVGGTETQRLVQDAVAEYLRKRRQASAQRLASLRKETKQRILSALESL